MFVDKTVPRTIFTHVHNVVYQRIKICVCLYFLTDFDSLNKLIKHVLSKATVLLRKFLDPSHILNELNSNEHLNIDDTDKIRQCAAISERVDILLKMLQRKKKEAYFSFMVALRKERPDLFNLVIDIESCYTSGMGDKLNIPLITI